MTSTSKRGALAATLATLGALLAPSAAAADMRVFKVTAEGSATYSRHDDSRVPGIAVGYVQDVDGSLDWRITIPRVVFHTDGTLLSTGHAPSSGGATGSGSASTVIYGLEDDQVVQSPGACSAARQQVPISLVGLEPDARAPAGGERGAHVSFTPFVGVDLAASCTGVLTGATAIGIGNDPNLPPTTFLHRFFLPKEAIDSDKIIQHVEQTAAQRAACPGRAPFTKSCELTWSGKLTFDLVEVYDTDSPPPPEDELVVPLTPGDSQGQLDEDSLVVPLRPRLSPDGARATVGVRCPTACRGSVRAFPVESRAVRGARSPRPIAVRRFRAPAGRARTVTLRFRGAARRKIRRAGAVRLVVTVGTSRRSVVAKLPRRSRAGS